MIRKIVLVFVPNIAYASDPGAAMLMVPIYCIVFLWFLNSFWNAVCRLHRIITKDKKSAKDEGETKNIFFEKVKAIIQILVASAVLSYIIMLYFGVIK